MRTRLTLIGSALLAAASTVAAYCVLIEPQWLSVTRLRISVEDLPTAWNGLRIAHLSDFHAGGPRVRLPFLQRAKAVALEFQPDLIALTGDYFDNGCVAQVDDLYTAWPEDIPILAVTGNHDHRGGPARYQALLSELDAGGVDILENRATSISVRGQTAWIVGVQDPHTRRDRVEEAFADLPPGAEVLIFLTHSPSAVESLPHGAAGLALSGHTHGGQIRIDPRGQVPFIHLIRRLKGLSKQPELPIAHGWHVRRGIPIIISNGIGVSSLPIRFRTRPQVILIDLVRAQPGCGPDIQDLSHESWLARLMR